MINQKGFAPVVIPLTLAIIGLLGTGVMAELDHEKNLVSQRDIKRQEDIQLIQEKLADYQLVNHDYPIQKNEVLDGFNVLTAELGNIPKDPLSDNNIAYRYWSDGQVYTLRYILEQTKEEQVVFSQ